MRQFLESKGILVMKDYFPEAPDANHVKAFEDHNMMGPDPDAPRVCLKQTFKEKWNKEVVDLLTAAFILAVQEGKYRHVQQTWPQLSEENVRVRCQKKLYRTQYICRTRNVRPRAESDKVNRMHQRRQEVCLLIGT
jgi:hypothetical protein